MAEIRFADRAVLDRLPIRSWGRREVLSRPGVGPRSLWYVQSGLLRMGGADRYARQRTYQFALEGWWMTEGLSEGGPPRFEVQALETTRGLALDAAGYAALLAEVPVLEGYFRRVYERAWAAAQRRLMLHETRDAETMYREFAAKYPEFVQRVPQYMLASFLGFSPEFLSRIRRRS